MAKAVSYKGSINDAVPLLKIVGRISRGCSVAAMQRKGREDLRKVIRKSQFRTHFGRARTCRQSKHQCNRCMA